MFCGFFKPKFYKKCKYSIKNMKIRLNILRQKKNATVSFMKSDIVEILKTGRDVDKAYKKVEQLLEELRILSSYDFIERFCDYISTNLSLMLKQSECPEDCKEAISSLVYAAAWIGNAPELKDLRALFTRRYGSSFDSSVNQELVEKLVSGKPSWEARIQKLQEIAQEAKIRWDTIGVQSRRRYSVQRRHTKK